MVVRVSGFDWDTGNRAKCEKHGVARTEVEEVFPDERHSAGSERRYLAIGRTRAGRHVFLAFTFRQRGGDLLIRPISARFMRTREIASYEEKKVPTPTSDDEAETFVENADLTEYDLSSAQPMHFEFEEKGARVNMRLPQGLLDAVKRQAAERGIPYQRFIRETLEHAVRGK